jgi:hypothetical protein
MLNENRFLGTFRGHNTRTICYETTCQHSYFNRWFGAQNKDQ